MISVSFVGDIMLGRFVADKYCNNKYELVRQDVVNKLQEADVRIANLESPIVVQKSDESLKFSGQPELLKQFNWVDCFSLSNNHINDFGSQGMVDTVKHLNEAGITYNGLYKSDYEPFLYFKREEKMAIITCTDMMNYEFAKDCPYKVLRMNAPEKSMEYIREYSEKGFFVILFLHAGMLFSRYLNPVVREFAHQAVEKGAGAVITAHSHCLGGYEIYKGALIFNSLGDFLMDGSSYRRRRSCILNLNIEDHQIKTWNIVPTFTSDELQTCLIEPQKSFKYIKRCDSISEQIKKHNNYYEKFYKRQYKKEMLLHSFSTLSFELNRRGFLGLLKIIFIRIGDVVGMVKRLCTDRSKMSYDIDAVTNRSNKAIK